MASKNACYPQKIKSSSIPMSTSLPPRPHKLPNHTHAQNHEVNNCGRNRNVLSSGPPVSIDTKSYAKCKAPGSGSGYSGIPTCPKSTRKDSQVGIQNKSYRSLSVSPNNNNNNLYTSRYVENNADDLYQNDNDQQGRNNNHTRTYKYNAAGMPAPAPAPGSRLPQKYDVSHRRSVSTSSSTPPNMNLSFKMKSNHRNSSISDIFSNHSSSDCRSRFSIAGNGNMEYEPEPEPESANQLPSYGFGFMNNTSKDRPNNSGWFWQKSLSEGNLQTLSTRDGIGNKIVLNDEVGDLAEMGCGGNEMRNSSSRNSHCRHCSSGSSSDMRNVLGNNSTKNHVRNSSSTSSSSSKKCAAATATTATSDNFSKSNTNGCTCSWNRSRTASAGIGNGLPNDAMKQSKLSNNNTTRKYFRSISLRNLLQIGGMNKSRQTPAQGKKVSPPIIPALVSFSSFRVKKNQQQQQQDKQEIEQDQHHHHHQQQQQRYSGSSLGSTGSSYNSSTSSGSSSTSSTGSGNSDNRSSIGTDDGFILPAPNGYLIKDFEDQNLYSSNHHHHHPPPPRHLTNSKSFDSFTSGITTVDMHQGIYGKLGPSSTASSNNTNTPNGHGQNSSQYVTVHVDPYYSSPNSSNANPNHITISHGSSTLTSAATATPSSAPSSTNNQPPPPSIQHHNNHHSQHQQHHHNNHLHHQHSPNIFSPSSQHSPLVASNSNTTTTTNNTNHYQTQILMEDQGIDMTQSPGRESPSSTASSNTGSGSGSAIGSVGSGSGGSGGSGSNGCRHSASSFDSGRASSSTIYQGVRFSGVSSESSGSFRHSYHSSNSSLGSIAPEDICNFDVAAMISQGIPDHEVINAWLTGIHFECYYQSFIQAGYDMNTICRMTPEDLNAIGVTKPNHRKRLKSEISQLNISEALPEYLPASIEEWLGLLKLEEYTTKLRAQGYHSVRQVTNISWEDLEEIGILKLGHQKKFMLAIKRVEDILSGKRISQANNTTQNTYMDNFPSRPTINTSTSCNNASPNNPSSHHGIMPYSSSSPQSLIQNGCSTNNGNSSYPFARGPPQHQIFRQHPNQLLPQQQQQQQQTQPLLASSSSSIMYSTGNSANNNGPSPNGTILTHQPQQHHHPSSSSSTCNSNSTSSTPQYQPEVISIQVKNGRRKSLENISAQEPIYGTSSFLPPTQNSSSNGNSQAAVWQRASVKSNYDAHDGETTPTNELQTPCSSTSSSSSSTTSTNTLPRLIKNKPIAKIMGGGCGNAAQQHGGSANNSGESTSLIGYAPVQQPQVPSNYGDGYKSLPRDMGRLNKLGRTQSYSQNCNGSNSTGTTSSNNSYNTLRTTKNGPPPPPRRGTSCSTDSNTGIYGQLNSFHHGNGNYSPWDSQQLPPPPPALSACGSQLYSSSAMSTSMDDLPPPPQPDDLVLLQSQSSSSPHSLPAHTTNNSHNHNTGPTTSKHYNNGSTPPSHNHSNNYNNTPKLTTTNSSSHYHHSLYPNSGSSNNRSNTPTNRSRDPSPVGSDFSDSDLPNNGLLSRGVRRNGSDASFKSNSSTESESIPFANDNAGTIKQQKPGHRTSTAQLVANAAAAASAASSSSSSGTGDVLSDIGNMLADLTDELDAILEQEIQSKRS